MSESKEMYLETILQLHEKGSRVRSIDVATELGFSRPSVSIAIKNLLAENLISVSEGGTISLTMEGMEQAKAVLERHHVLTEFFISLGAEKDSAEENACKIEHVISEDLFELIKQKTGR